VPIKTIRMKVSSRSGEEIPAGTGATVRIRLAGGAAYRADLTQAEAEGLVRELHADEVRVRAAKSDEEGDDVDDAEAA
jgi:hypothetical protein